MIEKIKSTKEAEESAEAKVVKGTRDYLPAEQIVRERITDVLKENFKRYGYGPIETSILERWDVAASKYGGGSEILKETYRLGDQGDRELCLRYELTFKLAKLIEMNPTIRLPFKRYEIGKVFRDGPVKVGRLREFTQCDIDVVGVKNLAVDAELIAMTFEVFSQLGLEVNVQLNNRKLLFGMFAHCSIDEGLFGETAISLDKLGKISEENVKKELMEKGVSADSSDRLFELLNTIGQKENSTQKLHFLEQVVINEIGKQGIDELKEIFSHLQSYGVKGDVRFIPTLARGLGYYTGPMWEVFLSEESRVKSSIAAGGRWDNMIKEFMKSEAEYPATGMTFGLDVIYIALEDLKRTSQVHGYQKTPTVLVIPLNTLSKSLEVATNLRMNQINCDVAFDRKLGKALEYANKQAIPYVVIVGEKELKDNKVNIRDMVSGKEELYDLGTVGLKLKETLRSSEQTHHS